MKKIFREPRFQLVEMEPGDGILQSQSQQKLPDNELDSGEPLGTRQDNNAIWEHNLTQ